MLYVARSSAACDGLLRQKQYQEGRTTGANRRSQFALLIGRLMIGGMYL
jgi:hypothetical protein